MSTYNVRLEKPGITTVQTQRTGKTAEVLKKDTIPTGLEPGDKILFDGQAITLP